MYNNEHEILFYLYNYEHAETEEDKAKYKKVIDELLDLKGEKTDEN